MSPRNLLIEKAALIRKSFCAENVTFRKHFLNKEGSQAVWLAFSNFEMTFSYRRL